MPRIHIRYVLMVVVASVPALVAAMSFDNRFIPLLQRPRITVDGSQSSWWVQGFATTASKSFNNQQQDIPIAEIFGRFDQVELARGIVSLGRPNPLPSEFQIIDKLPWTVSGKRQSQGIAITWDQYIDEWLSTGVSILFMRVQSRHYFQLDATNIEPNFPLKKGDVTLLDDARRSMLQEVGIQDGTVEQTGMGDVDWYMRVGSMWEYAYRFRRIDAGARVGLLLPTGVRCDLDKPASIPFGGQGHWGIYGELDAMFELKEDWKVGMLLRLNNRFSKRAIQRMPGAQEPSIFGAIVGPARINPGVTAIFVPYFLLENLRGGLSLGVNYNLVWHQQDRWKNLSSCVSKLDDVMQRSEWSSEYFTINVLYDFGKVSVKREFNPIITFQWDVPSSLFIASRINRAHRVSIGFDFVY